MIAWRSMLMLMLSDMSEFSVDFMFQSIVVTWEPPPDGSQNGIITGYKIRYKQKLRGERSGNSVTTDGNLHIMELTGRLAFDFLWQYDSFHYLFKCDGWSLVWLTFLN